MEYYYTRAVLGVASELSGLALVVYGLIHHDMEKIAGGAALSISGGLMVNGQINAYRSKLDSERNESLRKNL